MLINHYHFLAIKYNESKDEAKAKLPATMGLSIFLAEIRTIDPIATETIIFLAHA